MVSGWGKERRQEHAFHTIRADVRHAGCQEGCLGFGMPCKRLLQPRELKPPQGAKLQSVAFHGRRNHSDVFPSTCSRHPLALRACWRRSRDRASALMRENLRILVGAFRVSCTLSGKDVGEYLYSLSD